MQKQVTIKSGRSLRQAIDAVIKEQLKSQLYQNAVEEKDKQKDFLDEEDDDQNESGKEADQEPSKTVGAEKEKLKKGEVTPEDVIDKLNTIRSGKSFKDEAISSKLSEYVESLSKAEKTALLAFLKGISQIVTGEFEASQATDPADPGPDVEMKKGDSKKEKTIKPNIIKSPAKEKVKKPSAEDTSGPVPITPKRK